MQDDEPRAAAACERPVDLVHLSRQTMGDHGLEREVLGLFARQISTFSVGLDRAGREELQRIAHALKGACLNVGAFRLASAAEVLEHEPASTLALDDFEAEMRLAASFVSDLLRP